MYIRSESSLISEGKSFFFLWTVFFTWTKTIEKKKWNSEGSTLINNSYLINK